MLPRCGVITLLLLTIAACSANSNESEPQPLTALVKVYKSDQNLQCMKQGISLEKMATELLQAAIPIYCQQKNTDGELRPMMCGGPAGTVNVFQIPLETLARAKELGFEEVSDLPRLSDLPCPSP